MPKQLTIPSVISQEYEQVSVDRIKPHNRNVNQGDQGKIYQSIQDLGFYGACVVQRSTRLILAGSHRWEAAKQAGMPAVPVIWADVDDDAAIRIMLSDNATARAGNDNPNALAELLAELAGTDKGLSGTGFDGDDLQDLIDTLAGMPQSGLLADADPDAIPDDAPTRVKPGDLWQLGNHRILCGDSTKPEDVARLMGGVTPALCLTDPPYGIGIAANPVRQKHQKHNWDNSPATDAVIQMCANSAPAVIIWGGNYFNLPPSQGFFVWDKKQPQEFSLSMCEMAWTNIQSPAKMYRESVTSYHKDHPTQKPVGLMAWCMEMSEGDVFDPFLGSGTTLIAAEQAGRKCYGMEMEPKYCDVILSRYEQATGKTAELIENGTT